MNLISPTPGTWHLAPGTWQAAIITTREQAIQVAFSLAEQAKPGAIERDQQRLYPRELLDQFTRLGLGSISVPRSFGGGGLNYQTVADVFRIISASDPSLGPWSAVGCAAKY